MPEQTETSTGRGADTPPVLAPIPVDPGDAGGIGNCTERTITPGTLHETAEEVRDRGGNFHPAA